MQLRQMQRMGGLGALAGMMPGMGKLKGAVDQVNAQGNLLGRLDAIMGSMTLKERARPETLNAKRKIRIAKGSGTTVQDVNRLLKMHQEMATAMKKIRKMGGLGKLAGMFGGGGGGGGGMGGMGGPMGALPPELTKGLGGGGAPFNLPKKFK
jgi:signal recognition particle subunit SRP54